MIRGWTGLLFLVASAHPTAALAFSDPELFALPVMEGGGGGRFFTGSSSDGYACGVCHLGGAKPALQLLGLPEREFVPGAVFDVELTWGATGVPHALNLEFVTPTGEAAGSIVLPDPNSLEAADRCDAMHEGVPAAQLIAESAPRQVLWVDDCGAQRVRFRYVAPNVPQLMFAASVVRTDASEKPEGDGVLELRRELSLVGSAPAEDGCSVTSRARSAPVSPLLLACAALWLGHRRRRAG
ncbi:MAG TPA: hypothetical protein VFZ61_11800 [Polyangiales bacterium]